MVRKKEGAKKKPPTKTRDSKKKTKPKGALSPKKPKKPLKRKLKDAQHGRVC